MNGDDAVGILERAASELGAALPLQWRYPPRTPARPLAARPAASWRVLERPDQEAWHKNGPNWFYADLTFPRSRYGLRLAGAEALCFVHGWMPFTLWIDGEEIWREDHAWKATGPIGDPLPLVVEPGRTHRLVLCVTPTELPNRHIAVNVQVVPRPCVEAQVDLEAAAAQLRFARALAATDAERALVEEAAGAVDVAAVRCRRWGAVRESTVRMEERLAPFAERARAVTVHLVGHAHIDMDWMWTWPDTVNCIRRDFRAVTELMAEFPELTFTHSQVPTYEVVRRADPDVFRKVRTRMAEGRWENAAGTWVEGDLNMADGESIARHMLYAADWTERRLDSKARVLWEPDTFGHPGNMPQLARLGEFECYFHMRCHPVKGNERRAPGGCGEPRAGPGAHLDGGGRGRRSPRSAWSTTRP